MLSIRCAALAVVALLLRCHVVHGDFGIPPVITGATVVQQYATNAHNEATDVENAYGDITLDGPVQDFNEAGAAVVAVYEQIVIFVKPIANSVGALAVNDVGTVESLFGDADSKISAMQAFISGTAPNLLATVEAEVSVHVKEELHDILSTIDSTLAGLKAALSALRTGVINARTAAASNGGVYTSNNIQTNVRSSLVFAVQTKTLELQSDLPSALFSAVESARTINEANTFIMISEAVASGASLNELWESEMFNDYQLLTGSLEELEELVGSEIPLVTDSLGQFAAPFAALTDPLGLQYDDVSSVFDQTTAGVAANLLNGYKTLTSSTIGVVLEMLEKFFPPIEPAIRRLSEVLVQRGPYSDYCYETYYPKIEQYLFSGEMTVLSCLDIELGREKALMDALLEVLYQLQFFLEDTHPYLHVCYRLSLFDEDLANDCLQEHTNFSTIIPCNTIKEYATLLQLLCKEVDSIRFRLWACLSRDTVQFPIEASQILLDIETCRVSGPYSPA